MNLGSQDKKQSILGIILAVLLIAIGAVAYFGYFRQPSFEGELNEMAGEEYSNQPGEIINKIDFDEEFLKEARFQVLKIYGQWPIKLENSKKGRSNPFLSLEEIAEEEIVKEEIIELIEEIETTTPEEEIEEETGTTTPEESG